jgi:hypothetical protein
MSKTDRMDGKDHTYQDLLNRPENEWLKRKKEQYDEVFTKTMQQRPEHKPSKRRYNEKNLDV